ncbi:MAG: peptidoglycan-binding protein [Pseudomonadota bacterium]
MKIVKPIRPLLRLMMIYILIASFLLTGCSTLGKKLPFGKKVTTVNYYPICYEPIQKMRDAEKEFTNSVIMGALIGAATGAVSGALISGDAKGAVVGGVIGAAAGTGMGYYLALKNKHKDEKSIRKAFGEKVTEDTQKMSTAMVAARYAAKCYSRSFYTAINEYKLKKIDKNELGIRYEEIKNGLTEASVILDNMSKTAQEHADVYQETLTKINKKTSPTELISPWLIKNVQIELHNAGYKVSSPSGKIDNKTVAAIKQFQKDKGYTVDGGINTDLLAQLRVANNPIMPGNLSSVPARPSVELVKKIQVELNKTGYPVGKADGMAGSRTIAAIKKYEKDHGMPVKGSPNVSFLTALSGGKNITSDKSSDYPSSNIRRIEPKTAKDADSKVLDLAVFGKQSGYVSGDLTKTISNMNGLVDNVNEGQGGMRTELDVQNLLYASSDKLLTNKL